MAEGEEQPEFRGSKAPAVGCSEKEHTEGVFFRLEADRHHTAKTLAKSQLAEAANGLFFLEGGEGIVAKVAEAEQAAETRHQTHQIVVESFFLGGAAELIAQAHGNDRGWTLRVAVMQEECAGREPHDAE